ncbi:HdaA/DnaA family protein [Erythrobacter donghaensis]|jgi:chromosomal replication initiation ATPase DnaA|uniref:HdaA/DnaA family protein n=1 Tax=Erythrobacter donghaensis TaxID=267135 RepID=UPI0009391C51|nr:ATPase [Erythrobacter donghaensis]
MGEPSQIALPLSARGTVQRIVVGEANAAVVEALQHPERWPFRVAVLTGPPRSGKSLLARWAAGLHGDALEVIDDAQGMDETALFHRWNAVQQGGTREGGALLLVAAAGPEGWRITLPDLASRIGGSLQLAIGAPDDALAADLILAHAEARGLSLPEGAADYLVPRTTRSFAAIEALVATIDRISLERQTPATMSVWRAALEALHGPEQQRLL